MAAHKLQMIRWIIKDGDSIENDLAMIFEIYMPKNFKGVRFYEDSQDPCSGSVPRYGILPL